MATRKDLARARCTECNRAYRVPDAERTYTCKTCGGTVRAGVLEARVATSALKRGSRWLTALAWLYRSGAVAYALVTLVAVLALARTEVPLEGGILVVALSTLLAAVLLMGAIQVVFEPFAWTLAVALLASGVAVTHFFGPNPLGLALSWNVAWAVLFWLAVYPALQARRMIAEHKDRYVLHHASARTLRALQGRSPEERHERLVSVLHQAARRAWKTSLAAGGLLAAVSLLGTYAVVAKQRPETLDTARAELEAAWNAGDLERVAALFPPPLRERMTAWLAGITRGHWPASLPRLADGRERAEQDGHWIEYELGDVTLQTCWALDGQQWSLLRIELPNPPIEPTIERFLAAWPRSDSRAIAAFYPSDYEERMLASVENSVELRDWTTFPEVLDHRIELRDEGEAIVMLATEDGAVATKWLFRGDGTWCLQAIKFPKL